MMPKPSIPRWLKLQEDIDFLYFLLGQHSKQMPNTALHRMIDEATGYADEQIRDIRRIARRMKQLKREWSKETGLPASTEMEDDLLSLRPPRRSRPRP